MKQKYSIGLFIFIITFIYIVSITLPDKSSNIKDETTVKDEISISTDGNIANQDCFYLHISNGYVVIYRNDNKSIYEYTDICADELPEKLRQELKNGKYIESKEELYGFLENYSS